MVLDGHAKEILSIDFHPNGYQVATASGDDTVRIWDLRTLSSIYTIPAHKSSVADVRFFKGQDRNVEKMLQTNGVHDGVDLEQADAVVREQKQEPELKLSTSGMYLATAGYDGLLKIWSADDWQLLRSLSGDNGKVMSCDIQSGERTS
jgi:U4/U6 small nuclear ribonucleoprotein PRP4